MSSELFLSMATKGDDCGGFLIESCKLYDGGGVEIGFTLNSVDAAVYAMAVWDEVVSAKVYDGLFGETIIERKSYTKSHFESIKKRKGLGEHLFSFV